MQFVYGRPHFPGRWVHYPRHSRPFMMNQARAVLRRAVIVRGLVVNRLSDNLRLYPRINDHTMNYLAYVRTKHRLGMVWASGGRYYPWNPVIYYCTPLA